LDYYRKKKWEISDDTHYERKISALLRFYFKIDPDLLSDREFWMRWGDLKYCLEKTGNKGV
jgi:hypothetical protein